MVNMTRRGWFGALVGAAAAPKAAPVVKAVIPFQPVRFRVMSLEELGVRTATGNEAVLVRMHAKWAANVIGNGLKTRAEVMRELGVTGRGKPLDAAG